MIRSLSLVACVVWCQVAIAELTVDVKKATTVVTSVTTDATQLTTDAGDTIGDEVTTQRPPVVSKGQPVAVMILNSPVGFEVLKVKARCDTATVKQVLPNVYFVDKPGTHIVRFDSLSIEPFSWDDATVVVTVGTGPAPGPQPPPGPGPGPGPQPGPLPPEFDGLAARANVFAQQIPLTHRNQIVGILLSVADKMRAYEFKRSEQATEYIARNWPQCESPACGQLYNMVSKDAAGRLLSWQETQSYYRTIAEGVK